MILKPYIVHILLLLSVLVSLETKAQDPHFSQFFANPIYLNPAFAGAKVCPRVVSNYRNQWPAIPGSYVTYSASFDMHVDKIGGGIGVIVTSDRAGQGVLTTQSLSLIYSARIRLADRWFLKAGLEAGFFQKHLDWDKLTFGDQINPSWGFFQNTSEQRPSGGIYNVIAPDFSGGLLVYNDMFFGGVSLHHMVPVDISFTGNGQSMLLMKTTIHGGMMIPLTGGRRPGPEDISISPNIVYMQQGKFHQFNYGAYFKKSPMIFGVWYRQFLEGSDAIVLQVGFEYNKFKFGYSYDITVSKLSVASGGAHEFSFSFDFNCPQKKKRIHEINCPSF